MKYKVVQGNVKDLAGLFDMSYSLYRDFEISKGTFAVNIWHTIYLYTKSLLDYNIESTE